VYGGSIYKLAIIRIVPRRQLPPFSAFVSCLNIQMATKYAKDQPAGFTNRIERVAIVGVSLFSAAPLSGSALLTLFTI
jgi:hypothetical protein